MAKKTAALAANLDEKHVARLVEKWRARLLPREWSIGVRVLDAVPEEDREDCHDSFAYTHVEAAYFQAKITFLTPRLSGKSEEFLNLVACHEVLHVVLDTNEHLVKRACGKDEELATTVCENAVERLSRALVRLERGDGR